MTPLRHHLRLSRTISTERIVILSDARRIKRDLEFSNYDKWGFVVYRCTYGDDDAWDRFKNVITERSRQQILDSDAPEILKTLTWTCSEDRQAFDNASTATLRRHFNAWARENWQLEQPRGKHAHRPRYQYFIRVDRAALESVLDYPEAIRERPWLEGGYIDIVDATWQSHAEYADPNPDPEDEEFDQPDLSYEPIEGCREEDVGWMRLPAKRVGAQMYSVLVGHDAWYFYYERPPEIAFWV